MNNLAYGLFSLSSTLTLIIRIISPATAIKIILLASVMGHFWTLGLDLVKVSNGSGTADNYQMHVSMSCRH